MKKWILIFTIFLVTGCSTTMNSTSKDYYYMDTYINIKVYSEDTKKVVKALNKIDTIFQEYHELTDRYHHYDGITNIYDFNRMDINQEVTIDSKLYDILTLSKEYHTISEENFNIALGHVIDVWKAYRDAGTGVPKIEELKNSGSANINALVLKENNIILKTEPISIDLGAVAKGYTTEIVGDYLKEQGLTKYIINAGGNVLVGEHYANDTYKIGLEKPDGSGDIYKVIKANNKAVVTSGGYERFYTYQGTRYHHIINPNTYFPPNDKESVSVICNSSALCDIYSTTLFVMDNDKILDYIKDKNIDVIIYIDKDHIITSDGVQNYE